MREAFLLWRLVRRLRTHRDTGASASINLVQEKIDSATYRSLLEATELLGERPPPRIGWEVTLFLDNTASAKVHRGHTLREALARALAAT